MSTLPSLDPVYKVDRLLLQSLNSVSQIKTASEKSYLLVQPAEAWGSRILNTLSLKPARYTGPISPASDYSNRMIARRVGDLFDATLQSLTRQAFLKEDYLSEVSEGEYLIAFDKSWILPRLQKYFQEELTFELSRTPLIRERIASDYSVGQLKLTGEVLPWNKLRIVPFKDYVAVFAPVTREEAEKILLYLYSPTFLERASVVVNFSPELAFDFVRCNPVTYLQYQNWGVLSSDVLSESALNSIICGELSFNFPGVNDLTGAFATYLLAESTFYQWPLRWEAPVLYVGDAGYLQGLDLWEHFGRILNIHTREHPLFQELPSQSAAFALASSTDLKCFYHQGKYYAAVPSTVPVATDCGTAVESCTATQELDFSLIEMISPLTAVTREDSRTLALQYLSKLGYNTSPNPEPYHNNIKLISEDESYYYYASSGRRLELISDKNFDEVQDLLQRGYFFNQKVKNMTRSYPGFIPGDPPILQK